LPSRISGRKRSPGLWSRVEKALEEEAVKERGRAPLLARFLRLAPAAALIIAAAGLALYFGLKTRLASSPSGILSSIALARVEQTEKEYLEAIEALEEQTQPQMAGLDRELMFLYKDRLETVDAQIRRCREALESNPASPAAKSVLSKKFSRTAASAQGKVLTIDDTQGDLTITGGAGDRVNVDAYVEVGDRDEEFLKEFLAKTELVLEPYADGLRLRLRSPWDEMRENRSGGGLLKRLLGDGRFDFSYSARLIIRVPAGQSVKVDNSYGDVLIEGVRGAHRVINQSGTVRVEDCGGQLEVDNSYALVEVSGFKGPVDIENSSGEVSLKSIEGNASVVSSYKPVTFSTIGGNLTVRSESADVTGSGVAGDCEITTSYKGIDVRGVKGRLIVSGQSASVTADDISKDTVVESSYKPVRVTRVGGGVKVQSDSAAVTADDIGGDVFIRSSYNEIAVSNVRGSVDVDGDSALVSVRGIQGNARVATSYKDTEAATIGGWLDVRSQSGGVKASDIKQSVSIVTSYNPVEVYRVGGSLNVDGDSAGVLAEDISGDVVVRNSYKYVILRRTSGSIVVHGDSSPVEVDEIKSLPAGGRIEILTSYKPVTLTLPADAEVAIQAKSEYGKISSDFPVFLSGTDPNTVSTKLAAKLGEATVLVRIETSADIRITSGRIVVPGKRDKK
jgi:DUF4097 and DUF4098 domain-containing protein YvlB